MLLFFSNANTYFCIFVKLDMNYLVLTLIFVIIGIASISVFIIFLPTSNPVESDTVQKLNNFLIPAQEFQINPDLEYDEKYDYQNSLFQGFGIEGIHYSVTNENIQEWTSIDIYPNPELDDLYNEFRVNDSQKSIVIYPLFTASAYSKNGFYEYYTNNCDETCLTVKLQKSFIHPASGNAVQVLKLLGYNVITDVDAHKNPEILSQYDKVILLHNEYVTKEIFDAVDLHPNVVYLYPNALYAEIKYDEENDEITLVKGHGYPDSSIDNGFDWEYDNTRPYEFDSECTNWEFYEIDNGVMLNCYPEIIILSDKELLKFIKEF